MVIPQCQHLKKELEVASQTFYKLFSLFADCHHLYNEVGEVSSENIEYFSTYNHNVMQYMHMCLHISYMITPMSYS